MRIAGLAAAAMAMNIGLAGSMRAFHEEMPAFGSRRTPTFVAPVQYDGNGNKVKPKQHPQHNANRRTRAWREYAERVSATHSNNEDPRDDKYLHSSQRRARYDARLAREAKAAA